MFGAAMAGSTAPPIIAREGVDLEHGHQERNGLRRRRLPHPGLAKPKHAVTAKRWQDLHEHLVDEPRLE
eukprot:6872609-Pyramimonas_sp.AAC.1